MTICSLKNIFLLISIIYCSIVSAVCENQLKELGFSPMSREGHYTPPESYKEIKQEEDYSVMILNSGSRLKMKVTSHSSPANSNELFATIVVESQEFQATLDDIINTYCEDKRDTYKHMEQRVISEKQNMEAKLAEYKEEISAKVVNLKQKEQTIQEMKGEEEVLNIAIKTLKEENKKSDQINSEKTTRITQLKKEIKNLKAKYSEARTQLASLQTQVDKLSKKDQEKNNEDRERENRVLKEKVAKYESEISQLEQKLAETDHEQKLPELQTTVKATDKNTGTNNKSNHKKRSGAKSSGIKQTEQASKTARNNPQKGRGERQRNNSTEQKIDAFRDIRLLTSFCEENSLTHASSQDPLNIQCLQNALCLSCRGSENTEESIKNMVAMAVESLESPAEEGAASPISVKLLLQNLATYMEQSILYLCPRANQSHQYKIVATLYAPNSSPEILKESDITERLTSIPVILGSYTAGTHLEELIQFIPFKVKSDLGVTY